MNKTPLILLALVAFLALSLVGSYNGFVTQNQLVDQQWAQVETQYQRRFDLIPNLVKSVEGIMKQEQKIFGDLAAARANYAGATTVDAKSAAASQVESTLGRLLVIMENYPELKSNESVNRLMDELAGTENRIAVERQRFNESVTQYNLSVKRLPGSLIAGMFGFNPRSFFASTAGSDKAPEVNLAP
ncbi:MAG: LemA family protein [Candidatus Shapirobacteria bacterium]|jgi:LemA protein